MKTSDIKNTKFFSDNGFSEIVTLTNPFIDSNPRGKSMIFNEIVKTIFEKACVIIYKYELLFSKQFYSYNRIR